MGVYISLKQKRGGCTISKYLKAGVYCRFSSDNQREESIEAQLRAIEGYAKHNGIEIVKVYVDRAKSATSDKRPEFQQMIADSALGVFDVIIVHKLDRFSRDKYDSATYKRKLKKNSVRLLSVTENLDGSPESVILESLLEGMAEYYSKNLAREVMKGMKENAYKCLHTGGKPPLGYDVDPSTKRLVVNESEAAIIREIFRMYIDGYGYDRIIRELNSRGYRTKSGKPFGKNSLHDILANEKYRGVYVFNRSAGKDAFGLRNTHASKDEENIIRVEGGVPAIISMEDFEKARLKMEANRTGAGTYKAKRLYLLSGLIFCGECGHAMFGNHRKGGRNKLDYVSYRCGNRENKKDCGNKEIRREYVEGFVLGELERHLFNDKAIPRLVQLLRQHQQNKTADQSEEAERLKAQLDEVNRQIANIINAIANGYDQPSFKDRMNDLEERKAKIIVRLTELDAGQHFPELTEESIRRLLAAFRSHITERNLPEIKKFVGSYVQKVLVFKDHVEVIFNVAFYSGHKKEDCLQLKSSIVIKKLFRMFPQAV